MSDSPEKSFPEKKPNTTSNSALVPVSASKNTSGDVYTEISPTAPAKSLPANTTKDSDKTNPPVITEIPSTSPAPDMTTISKDSNSDTKKTDASSSSEPQFTTDKIGQWASRQENPFAEQNRRRQAKKQAGDDRLRKAAPYIFGGGMLALICGLIVCIIMLVVDLNAVMPLPEDVSMGSEGAQQVQDRAQEIMNKYLKNKNNSSNSNTNEQPTQKEIDKAVAEVGKFYEQQAAQTDDENKKIDVILLKMELYYNNYQLQQVVDVSTELDASKMSDIQKGQLWTMLANTYYNLDNKELGDSYIDLIVNNLEVD